MRVIEDIRWRVGVFFVSCRRVLLGFIIDIVFEGFFSELFWGFC